MLVVDGVEITNINVPDLSQDEIRRYIADAQRRLNKQDKSKPTLAELVISRTAGGKIKLEYKAKPPKFERIRRVTGYLVGSLDRWNNAKRAEERERVKHGVG